MIEVLSNFLRSVIVLSPNDLSACVYLCLNQLAPAYEGNIINVVLIYKLNFIYIIIFIF